MSARVHACRRAFMHVGARFRTSAQRSRNRFEFSNKFGKPSQMHVGARSRMKKCQFVSDQERLSAFDVLLTATICEAKSIKPPQDNARVNRADKLCKLVKLESDTMGGHDHPTTGQPQRLGRFSSTLCYPAFSFTPCLSSAILSAACLVAQFGQSSNIDLPRSVM